MKYLYYMLTALLTGSLLAGCEHQEPPYFDAGANGAYFYNGKDGQQVSDTINFADYASENPSELIDTLHIKLLGYKADRDRKLVLKTRPITGYTQAVIQLPEVMIPKDSTAHKVLVRIPRPENTDEVYGICIYLDTEDPDSELGMGIAGYAEYSLFVKEVYRKPSGWDYSYGMYLGEWNPAKHVFMAQVLKNNNYADPGDPNIWSNAPQYNLRAVDSLRTYQQNNPGANVEINIPFHPDVRYSKPFYWGELHDRYLGTYSRRTFVTICRSAGINTSNEVASLAAEEARLKEMNKLGVKAMMQEYNKIFSWQYAGAGYRSYCWVPMFEDIDYEVIRPGAWSRSSTSALLQRYYGEYSEEKYKFMIKTWLKHKGTQDFVLVQMFPVKFTWGDTDEVGMWDDSINGEEQIKECYRVFKAAYDQLTDASFTFPEVSL